VIESTLAENSRVPGCRRRRVSRRCTVGVEVGEFERKVRRVGVTGRNRGTPGGTDAAESENIDAGVEALADRWQ
jgi:hypothetical protein